MKQMDLTSEFIKSLKVSAKLPTEKLDRLMRAVGSDVGEQLVRGTPVDTGNARGHWYATIGPDDVSNPSPAATDAKGIATGGPDALTAQAIDQLMITAATAKFGDVVSFNNDCEYIEELENGHSQQAPNGMMGIVAQNFDATVEAAAQRLGIVDN